jgi:hypothetical protein
MGEKIFLCISFVLTFLINCNSKKIETDENLTEILNASIFENIALNKNRVIFEFTYNGNNYLILFYGKEITCADIKINYEYTNMENIEYGTESLMLEFDDAEFIIEELNKSIVANNTNYNENKINFIKISYIGSYDPIEYYSKTIIPTEKLVEYLTYKLLYIYYLPSYTVQDGDTLSTICLKLYGDTNYERIVKVNPNLKLPNQYLVVRPNQKIRISIK